MSWNASGGRRARSCMRAGARTHTHSHRLRRTHAGGAGGGDGGAAALHGPRGDAHVHTRCLHVFPKGRANARFDGCSLMGGTLHERSRARAHTRTRTRTRQGDYAGLLRLYAEWEDAGGVRKGLAWCKQARAQTHTHTTMHAQARKHARKHASTHAQTHESARAHVHTRTHRHTCTTYAPHTHRHNNKQKTENRTHHLCACDPEATRRATKRRGIAVWPARRMHRPRAAGGKAYPGLLRGVRRRRRRRRFSESAPAPAPAAAELRALAGHVPGVRRAAAGEGDGRAGDYWSGQGRACTEGEGVRGAQGGASLQGRLPRGPVWPVCVFCVAPFRPWGAGPPAAPPSRGPRPPLSLCAFGFLS